MQKLTDFSHLFALPPAAENITIAGLAADSRQVQKDFLFAALPGTIADGRDYIPQAVEKGATCILSLPDTPVPQNCLLLPSENPRKSLAHLASAFYLRRPETLVAVTGTNGKSSTVEFLRQLWASFGLRAASLGTLGSRGSKVALGAGLTTLDPVGLHQTFQAMDEDRITLLALEASSHGLVQNRLDGVEFDIALFTNLTQDHLDYHPDFDDYRRAKALLFSERLKEGGAAIINADSPEGAFMAQAAQGKAARIASYGWKGSYLRLQELAPRPDGQRMQLWLDGDEFEVFLPLIGEFQAHNAMAAAAVLGIQSVPIPKIQHGLERLQGVDGRLEWVGRKPNGANIYVDFAHTPHGIETLLRAIRPHTPGRLHILFGAGGDRDPGKRPEMGQLASRYADQVVVTDDNPRNEAAADIRRQILAESPGANEVAGRGEAIEKAIDDLASDDVLVIAGKGHETGQIIGDKILPFNDRLVAQKILDKLLSQQSTQFV